MEAQALLERLARDDPHDADAFLAFGHVRAETAEGRPAGGAGPEGGQGARLESLPVSGETGAGLVSLGGGG